ncbi:MAG: T9SS type A sorting domain-containing protein, partial [Prevotellaceae bacterium]|nr:T9SS type A sorting domain-containing protein [Prevotellaceae bacterium]
LHHAGSAQITAAQGGNTEYGAVSVSRTLVVNKVPLTVAVNNASRVYGDENPVFTFSYSGFKNDDTPDDIDALPEVTTSATKNSVVGTYTLTAGNASDNNYEFSYVPGQLEISKAILTIAVSDTVRLYGDANPDFTLSYNGFKNDDDESRLDVLPSIGCAADANSPVGPYGIVLSGGSDNNYEYILVNGTLEILPGTGVDRIETQSLKLYPNPVKESFIIEGITENTPVTISDANGNSVLQRTVLPNESIWVSHLPQGIYLVRVNGKTVKIIKSF